MKKWPIYGDSFNHEPQLQKVVFVSIYSFDMFILNLSTQIDMKINNR
jgi:hypothetical protein